MEKGNAVTNFLKEFANNNKLALFENKFGEVSFNKIKGTFDIMMNAGNIYGIWIELNEEQKEQLWVEVKGSSELKKIDDFKATIENWYPLYWGKDLYGAQRIVAHIKGHQNGNINMPNFSCLKVVKIIYGSVIISDYDTSEKTLINNYPPLLGTNRRGKGAKTLY